MRSILFDINVILDILFDRKPFSEPAVKCLHLVSIGEIEGYLSAHAVTTIYYISQKYVSKAKARQTLANLLSKFQVAPVNHKVLTEALALDFSDYEDAVTYAAALSERVGLILTRNIKDFKKADILVLAPEQYLAHRE